MTDTQPKLCINCKHLAKSSMAGPENWKCFAEQNIIVREIDLVTGETIVKRHFLTCYAARAVLDDRHDGWKSVENCGTEGKWFEPAPPKFMEVVPTGKPGGFTSRERADAGDLLSQLDQMK